jgi:hypothetical protein
VGHDHAVVDVTEHNPEVELVSEASKSGGIMREVKNIYIVFNKINRLRF